MQTEEQGKQSGDPQEPEMCGRTKKEWLELSGGCVGLTMLVIGIIYFEDCDAIPSLTIWCIVFSVVNCASAIMKFAYRLPEPSPGPATHFNSLLGISQLGIGVWGMVLSFPNFKVGTDPEQCAVPAYMSCLIGSAIIALALVAMSIYGVCCLLKSTAGGRDSGSDPSCAEAAHNASSA